MFTALASSPRVRSSSITNTQGLPADRLTYIAFAELQHACPLAQRYHVGRRYMNPIADSPYTAYIGLDATGIGLQVDPYPVSLLENADTLR